MRHQLAAVLCVVGLALLLASCDGSSGTETQGQPGAQGEPGPQGPVGPAGAAGVSGLEIVTVTQSISLNGAPVAVRADCPTGKQVLGGGFSHQPTTPEGASLTVAQNTYPSSATSWTVTLMSSHVVATALTVYAVCASTS